MKYPRLTEPVFVNSIEAQSSRYSNEIWRIEFIGIQSQNSYHTWVDPRNNNYSSWHKIIHQPHSMSCVLSGLKFKDQSEGIVNADSRFTVEWWGSRELLAQQIADLWASKQNFNQLFG